MVNIQAEFSDDLRPQSKDEESKRAYFVCRELETRCTGYVKEAITQHNKTNPPETDQDEAIKLMTWSIIYLSAIRCGGVEAQSWLLDFIARALKLADEYTDSDDARKFLKNLGGLQEPLIISRVAQRVCSKLQVKSEGFNKQTQAFIEQSAVESLDLLNTALSLPIDTLRDLVQLINANDQLG